LVETAKGTRFMTKTVFIAGGVGSFQPRTLKVDGLEKFDGTQLHYRVRNPAQFAGKNLVIVGGGDSALDWALNFAQDGPHKAESVILVHRRDGFRAAPASVAKMKELCEAYEMQFVVGQVTGFEEDAGQLKSLKLTGADGVTRVMPLDMLLVFFGLSPKLGPIADWGLGIDRKQITVDTEKFQSPASLASLRWATSTSTPARRSSSCRASTKPRWRPLRLRPYVFPEKRVLLQYTTTSPKLHKVLGVETPNFD
jgi:thioredoxin reductase (NADPH)